MKIGAIAIAAACCGLAQARPPIVDAWKYTLGKPADGWTQAAFDDRDWKDGPGGFGTRDTPGARVGTAWQTADIWLRKTFRLDAVPEAPALLVHHDEDAEVFINGVCVASLKGYVQSYKTVPIGAGHRTALKAGDNVMAVHCRQTTGGQFIDAHLVDAGNVPELPPAKRATTPFQSELITKWGSEVTPENAWTEYPRPQLAREEWQNLNGRWDYAITPVGQKTAPTRWDGKILVPYCLESKLGGVGRLLDGTEALWYRRDLTAPAADGRRTLLNFEAVDYRCEVFLNGRPVGAHQGGNTPFSIDVTDAVREGENELIVRVEDETEGWQLRGKQVLDARGIWYTQVSGIWQTVWLERVGASYIEDLTIVTDAGRGTIILRPVVAGDKGACTLRVAAKDRGRVVAEAAGDAAGLTATIANAKLWSPDSPHLYDLEITLLDQGGKVVDRVRSYAGIRDVGKARDGQGHMRFTLNGKPIFHLGPLDQGWWPDGLLTPPSDEAMLSDIEFLKAAGFNMIRKHIKVEPRRYYYHCDRLGMMLWQDHVSGGESPKWTFLKPNPEDAAWPDAHHGQFMLELERMIDSLESHPSVVVWVPFNERWGQHRTVEVGQWVAKRDPRRLVNIASGGNFWPVGDIADAHKYPHPGFPFDLNEGGRFDDYIKVVGEFGGHGFAVQGHLWDAGRRNWGYGGLPKDEAEYKARYATSIKMLNDLRAQGIAGGVYTQTTDVEGEINGLMTYDRKVVKIPAAELRALHACLFAGPPPAVASPGNAAARAAAAPPPQWPEGKPSADADGRPMAGLRTKWADLVNRDAPLPEHPRPQMVRDGWTSLNGPWDCAILPEEHDPPCNWDAGILVPFCIESQLSGLRQFVGQQNRLWYRRKFKAAVPEDGKRLLLHFGAVDWEANVWVNWKHLGRHRGGYDPFTFDITEALKPGGEQELVVSVWDPTDAGEQPRGKQVREPKGIWYTSVTGIWQPVWLEPVPAASVASVLPVPDPDAGVVRLTVAGRGVRQGDRVRAVARDGASEVGRAEGAVGECFALDVPGAKLWSPDSPHLYDLDVELVRDGNVVDTVKSYFAMRKIERRKSQDGFERLFLNGKPLFQFGPLDQGWWPDGLYTAPTDEALRYDIEATKRIGCNMIRKHVKVEPARWYYHCDRLGMLVWQDMPSAFNSGEGKVQHVRPDAKEDWARPEASAKQFEEELREVIEDFRFFPSIVMWVPFNEGWGQYDTARIAKQVKQWDPSRLVNAISGWTDRGVGDVMDVHQYPGPGMEPVEQAPGRAVVLGEFGGLGLPVKDHLWWDKRNWGYQTLEGKSDLLARYENVFHNLVPMLGRGLAAAVYTQTTDVEGEVNGYLTYDRAVLKFDAADLARIHAPLYQPAAKVTWLLRDAEMAPQQWRYTCEKPADGWEKPGFDDGAWQTGDAPFRGGESPFVGRNTEWSAPDIWMRRAFEVARPTTGLSLKTYFLQEFDVFLNGEFLWHVTGRPGIRHYDDINVSAKAGLLRKGRNIVAVRASKPKPPRVVDLGLYGYDVKAGP